MPENTYTYADLLNIVRPQIPTRVDDLYGPILCNMAISAVWDEYDWPESIAEFVPFYLVPGIQDYTPPFTQVPADFSGLRAVRLVEVVENGLYRKQPLTVRRDLESTGVVGLPSLIGYCAETGGFRVYPRPPEDLPYARYIVEGTYKKGPAKVTAKTLDTKLPLSDGFLPLLVHAMILSAYTLTGDSRAREQGLVLAGMLEKKAREYGLFYGDASVSPAEPLDGVW